MPTVNPQLNKANREVCDVDVRVLSTMAPFLHFDTANVTTAGLSGDSVYAMAKGQRRIAYHNPMTGTMTMEAQVYPFKLFAMLTDGVIEADGLYAVHETVTCSSGGSIVITPGADRTVVTNSVRVYAEGKYGDFKANGDPDCIEGTFNSTSNTFTATTQANIENAKKYEVSYMLSASSGIKRIRFSNKKVPKDYYVTMRTLDKDEAGALTPFLLVAYKATVQRTWELSFTSEGDPASVTVTFDLLEDKDGNILDMIELTDRAT